MRLHSVIVVAGLSIPGCTSSGPPPSAKAGDGASQITVSPHTDALRLVFDKCADRIRHLEGERAWFDTDERIWSVKRPFEPGVIDSTHAFYVEYRINGKSAVGWSVDTDRGTVDEADVAKP